MNGNVECGVVKTKRLLPEWMQNRDCKVQIERIGTNGHVSDQEKENLINKLNSETIDEIKSSPAKRYRTRSSVTRSESIGNDASMPKKKPNSVNVPRPKPAFIDYKGKVEYFTEFNDIAFAADNLLNWVNKQESNDMIPIAFDMEWPFTFQTGPGKTAVIQLCADINMCYVFHLPNLKKLPAALIQLLLHDKICLHGVNIKNDCRKLERDFPEVNAQKMIDQCVDLGVYCNKVMNTGGRWSMERLVWYLCRLKINKDKKVRNSKWHVMPLSPEQQIYAAIDVYISQVMFLKLRRSELEREEEARKFIEEHGQEAYIARQKLL